MKKLNNYFFLIVLTGLLSTSCGKNGTQGPIGPQGPIGVQGPAGANGTRIYSGTTVPDMATGAVGDFYIDLATGIFYGPKTTTSWGNGISLKGAPGSAGVNGTNGTIIYSGNTLPATTLGTVGDFYIDLETEVLYGPKTANGWGNGVSLIANNIPVSNFNFTINNTGSLPVNVVFSNSATGAISYFWDFNDGATSTAPNPQHTFTSKNSYFVKLTVTNASGSVTSTKVINISGFLQSYTSFDSKPYSLYSWEGKYVTILMRNPNLDPTIMYHWANTMDSCYLWYASVTGQEPTKYTGITYLNNRSTIADVATTCGAGCGYLGYTGIEMQNTYTDRMYNYILQNNEYDQELFYEFGRNFWFYGNQLAYKTNDPVTTGYAIFMRFMAMDALKVNPAPFNNTPWATFRTDLEGLVDIYQTNTSYNWNNTLGAGAGVTNPLNFGAGDLLASFLIRLQRDYGGNTFVNKFWKQAGTMPSAVTTQDAVDNFVLAACYAANKNLNNLFVNTWQWPVSSNAQSLASKYP